MAGTTTGQTTEFKFPSEVVDLPSKGKCYGKTHPCSSGKIEIKYMTAKESRIDTLIFDEIITGIRINIRNDACNGIRKKYISKSRQIIIKQFQRFQEY